MTNETCKDLLVEINLIETPMFSAKLNHKGTLAKDLLNSNTASPEILEIVKAIVENNDKGRVSYQHWSSTRNSNQINKEVLISSDVGLPDKDCLDVLMALTKKLLTNNGAFDLNKDGTINVSEDTVSFSLYELCKIMKEAPNGRTYKKIRNSLLKLKSANYYSINTMVRIHKGKKKTIDGRTEMVNLLDKVILSGVVDGEFLEGEVQFSEHLMNNIKSGYARILRNDVYFQIKTGIRRLLYIYIENNRDKIYTKRNLNTLANKIPITYTYTSQIKRALNSALPSLVDAGILTDWFYGTDVAINGVKENCIYFVFKGDKTSVISSLQTRANLQNTQNTSSLSMPTDIKQELIDFGVNPKTITKGMSEYTVWELAELILWVREGIANGKVKAAGGMLTTAIEYGIIDVKATHPHIVAFVEEQKNKANKKKVNIHAEYDKYISREINKIKKDEKFLYDNIEESIYKSLVENIDKRIASQVSLSKHCTTDTERNKIEKTIQDLIDAKTNGKKSEYFKKQLKKEMAIKLNLKNIEQFISENT